MFSGSSFPQFDPSKMDPKVMMELSQLIQSLPPEKLSRMQVLMHNMMGGFDVRKDMEEFEKGLPPDFRLKLMSIMAKQSSPLRQEPVKEEIETFASSSGNSNMDANMDANMDVREARLTLLRAVASGDLSPEEAEKLL